MIIYQPTYQEFIDEARNAFERGDLQAQQLDQIGAEPSFPCLIAAPLPIETQRVLQAYCKKFDHVTVVDMMAFGRMTSPDPYHTLLIIQVQFIYDNILKTGDRGFDSFIFFGAIRFVQSLYQPEQLG